MKKILIAFAAVACLFAFTAAHAADGASADGAELYKSHCQGCHGVDGSRAPSNGVEPLKGMGADDINKKLLGYKDGSFGGPAKQVMQGVVKKLSEEQMKGVADYAAGL